MTITLFTILKSMEDPHIAMIQRNALKSWMHIQPTPEILVFGNKLGVSTLAHELGLRWFPNAVNENGLEYVDWAFSHAALFAENDMMCYCNGDMILPPYFESAIASINHKKFLGVGQRWNLPYPREIVFDIGWWRKLQRVALIEGAMHPPSGIDYFVHRREDFVNEDHRLPKLLVGRWYWDNYMLYRMKELGGSVIDMTEGVFAIHQNHDYSHFPGGLEALGNGEESMANKQWLPEGVVTTISDADYKITPAFGGVRRK